MYKCYYVYVYYSEITKDWNNENIVKNFNREVNH